MASMLPPIRLRPDLSAMSLPNRLRIDLEAARRQGSIGTDGRKDTVIAQINPHEAMLLKLFGGSGTINPRTGLRQFDNESDHNAGGLSGPSGNMGSGPGGAHGYGNPGGESGGGGHSGGTGGYARNQTTGQMVGANGQVEPGTQTSYGLSSTGETTPWGAPVRVNSLGIKTALSPAAWNAWQGQVGAYNQAATKWNAGAGRSVANLVNDMAPMGLSMEAPNLNRPATYTGGDYHLGINPAAAIGGILGSATMIPGAGTAIGAIAGKAYSLAGGQNPVLTGPARPDGWDPNGAAPLTAPRAPSQSTAAAPGYGPGVGASPGGSQLLAAQAPVLPGAAVAAPAIPGAPQQPAGPQTNQIAGLYRPIWQGYGTTLPGYSYLT